MTTADTIAVGNQYRWKGPDFDGRIVRICEIRDGMYRIAPMLGNDPPHWYTERIVLSACKPVHQ